MLFYAGIGSRSTPPDVLEEMKIFARSLAVIGHWTLRSGGAAGADSAFESGVLDSSRSYLREIYVPSPTWRGRKSKEGLVSAFSTEEAEQVMERFHPSAHHLTGFVRLLMARNSHQILGPYPVSAPSPVRMVVCWTKDGAEKAGEITIDTGGTGQALRIACAYNIPVFNLKNEDAFDRIWAVWNVLNSEVRK